MQGLQKRGQQVVPLKYRRETPLKPIPVEALCDFEGDQVSCCLGAPSRAQICLFSCPREVLGVTLLNEGLKHFQEPVPIIGVILCEACVPCAPLRPPPSYQLAALALCAISSAAPVSPTGVSGRVLIGPI